MIMVTGQCDVIDCDIEIGINLKFYQLPKEYVIFTGHVTACKVGDS